MSAGDEVREAIQRISDLVRDSDLINLDLADVTAFMTGRCTAIIGTGDGRGQTNAVDAANRAVSSLFPEGASLYTARGVIITITGGEDLSLREVSESSSIVHAAVHRDANIIYRGRLRQDRNIHQRIDQQHSLVLATMRRPSEVV